MRELAVRMRAQRALDSERIHAAREDGESPDMSGILLYTTPHDGEGTLRGLVSLRQPDKLGRLLDQALKPAARGSSDPSALSTTRPEDASVHVAPCHACPLAAESLPSVGTALRPRGPHHRLSVVDLGASP
jgi:hypothetical protein